MSIAQPNKTRRSLRCPITGRAFLRWATLAWLCQRTLQSLTIAYRGGPPQTKYHPPACSRPRAISVSIRGLGMAWRGRLCPPRPGGRTQGITPALQGVCESAPVVRRRPARATVARHLAHRVVTSLRRNWDMAWFPLHHESGALQQPGPRTANEVTQRSSTSRLATPPLSQRLRHGQNALCPLDS
jgi:hypothetical protein